MSRTIEAAQPVLVSESSFKLSHRLIHGDARSFSNIKNESVHLVVTSPPYWTLKRYNDSPLQMGHIEDYELFLDELDKVWREAYRTLVPGGR